MTIIILLLLPQNKMLSIFSTFTQMKYWKNLKWTLGSFPPPDSEEGSMEEYYKDLWPCFFLKKYISETTEDNSCSGPQIFHSLTYRGLLRVPISFVSETEILDHGMCDEPCGLPEDMQRKAKRRQISKVTYLQHLPALPRCLNQNHRKVHALQIQCPHKNTLHFKSSTILYLSFSSLHFT